MIITLGAFDGFHSGHQKLFNAARRIANENRTGALLRSSRIRKFLWAN